MPSKSSKGKAPGLSNFVQFLHDRRWRKATNCITKFPNEISKFRTSSGWSMLHLACHMGAPETLIAALLKADSKAASHTDSRGFSPLHVASCSSTYKVMDMLVNADPGQVHQKAFNYKFTPLQLLCLKYHKKLAETISQPFINGTHLEGTVMLLMKKVEVLIIASYYSVPAERMVRCDPLVNAKANWRDEDNICSLIEEKLDTPFKTRSKNLVAALVSPSKRRKTTNYSGRLTRSNRYVDGIKLRMVHACAGIKDCPSILMNFALKVFPNQVTEADEDGNLPIHIAAGCVHRQLPDLDYSKVRLYLDAACRHEESDDVATNFAHVEQMTAAMRTAEHHERPAKSFQKSVLELLLASCPSAAKVYNTARKLPMHIALESGRNWDDGIRQLHEVNLESINRAESEIVEHLLHGCVEENDCASNDLMHSTKNKDLDLFPFMYAACHGASLSAIYCLFRACPEISRFSRFEALDDLSTPSDTQAQKRKRRSPEIEESKRDFLNTPPHGNTVVSWSSLPLSLTPFRSDVSEDSSLGFLLCEPEMMEVKQVTSIEIFKSVSASEKIQLAECKKRKAGEVPMPQCKKRMKLD